MDICQHTENAGGVPKCNGVLPQRGGSGLRKEEGGGERLSFISSFQWQICI